MSGLLRRAQDYIGQHPHLRILSPQEMRGDSDGISEEERQQISEQINRVVAENRIQVDDSTFAVTPTRRGGVIVLAVNLVAAAVLAGAVFGALRYFDSQQQTITAPEVELTSTEGLLLQQLQQETEARLSEKDQEIAGIMDRLQEIDAEREALATQTDQLVQQREEAIRAEYERRMLAERERLAGQGMSQADIDAEIQRLQVQQAETLQDQLDAARAEAEAEIAQRQAAMDELVAEYQTRLNSAEAEREALSEEVAQATAALQERAESLTVERNQALNELSSLQEQQARESNTLSQLTALYQQIRSDIRGGNYGEALSTTREIRVFLNRPTVAELPGIQRRREVDLFLADSLSQLIEYQERESSIDTQSLVETAGLVAQASDLISNADALLREGDVSGAEELYRAAIARVPPSRVGLERLREIEQRAQSAQQNDLAQILARGNQLYLNEQYQEAAQVYEDAVGFLPWQDAALYSRLLDTGYQLRAEADRLRAEAELREARAAAARETQEAVAAAEASGAQQVTQVRAELREAQAEVRAVEQEAQVATERVARLEAQIEQLNAEFQSRLEETRRIAQEELRRAVAEARETTAAEVRAETRAELENYAQEYAEEYAQDFAAARIAEVEERASRELAAANAKVETLESDVAELRREAGAWSARAQAAQDQLERLRATQAARAANVQRMRQTLTPGVAVGGTGQGTETGGATGTSGYNDAGVAVATGATGSNEAGAAGATGATGNASAASQTVGASGAGSAGSTDTSAEVLQILETKLLLLRVTNSEVIRSQHPDLYERTQSLFDDLVAADRIQTTASVLSAVNEMMEAVLGEDGWSQQSGANIGAWNNLLGPTATTEDIRRQTVSLLDRIEQLTSAGR